MFDTAAKFMPSIIPPWVKIAAVTLAAAALFGAGMLLEATIKEGEIANLKLAHETAVAEAEAARNVALERARATEQKAAEDLAALTAKYVEDQQHEKAITQRRIADLAAGNERLRVAIEANSGNGGVPGTTTGASGGDGQATATIARPVAARFAQRYADYNEIVAQLDHAQAIIIKDREVCGSKTQSSQ